VLTFSLKGGEVSSYSSSPIVTTAVSSPLPEELLRSFA
jgi:hypothetical protein